MHSPKSNFIEIMLFAYIRSDCFRVCNYQKVF